MNAGSPVERTQAAPGVAVSWKTLANFVVYTLLTTAILFVAAGRLDWLMGWLYVGTTLALTAISRVLVVRKNPDLAVERARYREHADIKPWDRKIMPWVALVGPFAGLLVAGLDKRFGWSPAIPQGIQIAGLVLVILGYAFSTWALLVNRFFSAVVRIQKERGHTVVTAGPYRYVRHPGYAGGIITFPAGAIALGSLWALIPAALTVTLTVVRTALEDRTLQEELAGYKEYAGRVRYRLLPGIW